MRSWAITLPVLATLSLILGACQANNSTHLDNSVSRDTMSRSSNHILSGYKSWRGVNGGRRIAPHAGVDFEGRYGEPILAASDGVVNRITSSHGCGRGVIVYHPVFYSYTVYCHMSKVATLLGQNVKRGEVIGFVGTSGNSRDVAHVHFELSWHGYSHRDGDTKLTRNPAEYIVGCYDQHTIYSRDKLVLVEPLFCK